MGLGALVFHPLNDRILPLSDFCDDPRNVDVEIAKEAYGGVTKDANAGVLGDTGTDAVTQDANV